MQHNSKQFRSPARFLREGHAAPSSFRGPPRSGMLFRNPFSGEQMYVVGTAGHVDHGKSSLVRALTGIDPDRLQEEKRREMTIDLGFAWLTLPSGREVSIVDVPGHERFIKNMLAGVGGVDLALLVVAADESVMPQTREHLAILDLIEVTRGVVALTKADLVEEEWLEIAAEEVAETLEGSALQGVDLVPVSAFTGQGLDKLKGELDRLLEETPPPRDMGRPRLSVDRAFAMAGFGAVVTGTLLDGALSVGQEVELVPSGLRGRVRGLQTHQRRIDSAEPGSRVAVNLSGVSHTQVQRGEVLTLPGWLRSTRQVDVFLRSPRWAPHSLKHNAGVTFHTGASETAARVRLLEAEVLKPGEEGWAQVHLEQRLPLVKGDTFVVRSPVGTLGGGRVVDPAPRRHRRGQRAVLHRLEALERGSPREALLQALPPREPLDLRTLIERVGLPADQVRSEVESLLGEGLVLAVGTKNLDPGTAVYSATAWGHVKDRAAQALREYHGDHPLRPGLPREELRSRLGLSAPSVTPVLAELAAQGALVEEGALVRAPEHRVRLAPEQERAATAYLKALDAQPYTPPTDSRPDPELLSVLASQGKVVRVSAEIVFSSHAYTQMVERIVERLSESGKVTVADVRDMFGASRKYALPLLEYLDQQRITRRVGDERVLVKKP